MTTAKKPDTAKLRKLWVEAAPGPWVSTKTANEDSYYVAEFSSPGARGIWTDRGVCSQATSELIAEMHSALPYLLDAADEYAAYNKREQDLASYRERALNAIRKRPLKKQEK